MFVRAAFLHLPHLVIELVALIELVLPASINQDNFTMKLALLGSLLLVLTAQCLSANVLPTPTVIETDIGSCEWAWACCVVETQFPHMPRGNRRHG